jgi:transcriptional regulator with PAS, ATPase and Fis domain
MSAADRPQTPSLLSSTEDASLAGAMLKEFVSGLGAGDARAVRARFEHVVRQFLHVPYARLREGPPDPAGPVAVSARDRHAAAAIPVPVSGPPMVLELPRVGSLLAEDDRRSGVSVAVHLAAIVCEIERAAGFRTAPATTLAQREGSLLAGMGDAIQRLRQLIDRVARTDFTVLIEGESGVGKELVARQIHLWSRRARGPFVAVNCAALVETLFEAELFGIEDRTATGVRGRRGKFEQAEGGTLFLDEVADLSLQAQAKLLRALQEFRVERVGGQDARRVDIRLIVATNRSLAALVAQRQFREDLYYRLNALEVKVPPLRTRREDIIDLAQACLERHAGVGARRLSAAALEALLTYEWPGNVRELERVIERSITHADGDEILLCDLPPAMTERYSIVQPAIDANDTMRAWGSRYARLVLERCHNNKRQACRILGISYHTLQAYLRFRPRLARRPPRSP